MNLNILLDSVTVAVAPCERTLRNNHLSLLACLFASPPLSLCLSLGLSHCSKLSGLRLMYYCYSEDGSEDGFTLILVEGNRRCSGSVRTCSGISTQNQGTETLLFSMCLVVKSKSITRW